MKKAVSRKNVKGSFLERVGLVKLLKEFLQGQPISSV